MLYKRITWNHIFLLELPEIFLVFFVESVDDKSRKTYEVDFPDKETGVKVLPIFVETGN